MPIAAVLSFFGSPLGKIVGGAVAAVALLGGVWLVGDRHGHAVEKAVQERALAAAKKVVAKTDAKTAAIATEIKTKTEAAKVEIRWRTQYLTKEVPTHVTPQADDRCVVPLGYVRLYDHAATGMSEVPGPADRPNDADSGIALSAVAETDVANLGAGNEAIAEVKAWREWYGRERAAYQAAVKP